MVVSQGVVEEKSTRVVEVLLSVLTPLRLLVGKVLGIGISAFVQMGVLAAVAIGTSAVTDTSSVGFRPRYWWARVFNGHRFFKKISPMDDRLRGAPLSVGRDTGRVESERIRTLQYSVQWVDQHPLSWDEAAFPVTYRADGWDLLLSEKRLDASPSTALAVDEARSQLAPLLAAWSASIEVEHRLIVTFFYLGADVERDEDRGGVTVADFAGCSDEATSAIQRAAPPAPNGSFQDTDTASLARTLCLRPMRNGTRPVADAAYYSGC
ncbi:hypothetical protein AAW14_00120 [Streptomyces hygroscopicus]|uniref:ABC transporter permease n=1 Tax=Streptomyces hygroscopicus TaxID=1912 RepID=UPI00223F706C|nr:ABC transporter permease [Streptomyces hygroscopicus]MCW7940522.1 hypothetical protein [Streptomyces hygroscopicus]